MNRNTRASASSRIIRVQAKHPGIRAAFDAAPDEETLPTIYRCAECGFATDRAPEEGDDHDDRRVPTRQIFGHWHTGRFEAVPLPVHLGVEVTP